MTTSEILKSVKAASKQLVTFSESDKNAALSEMAKELVANTDKILLANKTDMENAAGKINEVMLDRLKLTAARINAMAQGILDVEKLPDPVGKTLEKTVRADGLEISKISVPLGVVAIKLKADPMLLPMRPPFA